MERPSCPHICGLLPAQALLAIVEESWILTAKSRTTLTKPMVGDFLLQLAMGLCGSDVEDLAYFLKMAVPVLQDSQMPSGPAAPTHRPVAERKLLQAQFGRMATYFVVGGVFGSNCH